jgi:hypothetical protein
MNKFSPNAKVALHKLMRELSGWLSPQEHQRLHTIATDPSPLSDLEANRWLVEMEQEAHERIAKGRGNV